jgi:dUTPase
VDVGAGVTRDVWRVTFATTPSILLIFPPTHAGVIDSDYRGEVKVLLFNFSDDDFVAKVSAA